MAPRAATPACGASTCPTGGRSADPHYAYKLNFLDALREAAVAVGGRPALIAGDFNVAPLTTDIWSEADGNAETHVTVEARAAFHALASAGYEELSRRYLPDPNTYTFWDYQQLRFPRGEGMRIDFVYASAIAAARATGVTIDREERKGQGASDHVPVIVDLADAQ